MTQKGTNEVVARSLHDEVIASVMAECNGEGRCGSGGSSVEAWLGNVVSRWVVS